MRDSETLMTDLTKLGDAEILELIEPMMDRMLEGSARIDHAMHVQDFTDRLKSIVTEERLGEMCRDYQARIGVFAERRFVRLYRRRTSVAAVWVLSMTGTDDEMVLQAAFVWPDGKLLMDHAMFF